MDSTPFEPTWAVVEMFGKTQMAGFVSLTSFGLFQVDVPPLPEREYVTERPGYHGGSYCPAGTTVKREAKDGRTRFIGSGAIYALNPCTEQLAMAAVERLENVEVKVVSMPVALIEAAPEEDDDPEGWRD